MTRRQWLPRAGALLVLLIVGVVAYPFLVGGSRMERFCESVRAGDTEVQVVQRARRAGYVARQLQAGDRTVLLVVDADAMGRFVCELALADGRVTVARYVLND